MATASTMVGYNVGAIQKMFHDYVEETGGKPRHTQEANYEVSLYRQFIEGAFPSNSTIQDGLFDRMMSCAVEFEESGFIAGFREGFQYAFQFFRMPESPIRLVTIPGLPKGETSKTETPPETGSQAAARKTGKEAPPAKAPATESGSAKDDDCPDYMKEAMARNPHSISTKDIANMFEVTHASVVKRIETLILPKLDDQSRKFFHLNVEITPQNRRYRVYYLNKAACDIYMRQMDTSQKFINIASGLVKMREMVKKVFPVDSGKPTGKGEGKASQRAGQNTFGKESGNG